VSAELDLAPRPAPPARRRRPWAYVVLALVLAGLAIVVFQGLTSATLYYRNADEAVAQRDSLGTRRFRVQGTVQPGVEKRGETLAFDIAFNGVSVPVRYTGGEPTELYKPCIGVVLEGRWDGDVFASDRLMIKHSSTYESEHPERLSTTCPAAP
jgi:cytochrome c-type biogenesis protein CcmE